MTLTVQQPPNARSRIIAALPPFPAVAVKLLKVISNDDCALPQLSQLVRSDACFSAEILRLANSPVLAMRFQVVSVLHAVSVLGIDRLRSLVITIAMRDMLRGAKTNDLLKQSWRHNFACALACEWMGEACGMDRSVSYTAGLLHELGRLAMVGAFGNRYLWIHEKAVREGHDLEALERSALGIDQFESGAILAEEWNLPPALAAAVSHRRPALDAPFGVAHLVAAGCDISNRLGFPIAGPAAEWDPGECPTFR